MKRFIRDILLPIRRFAGRFVVLPEGTLNKGYSDLLGNLDPIRLAADFVCAEYVPGDYLEFGVFRGSSFVRAHRVITEAVRVWSSRERAHQVYTDIKRAEEAFQRVKKNQIRFFAFDSFEGLPEPTGIDQLSARFAEGRYDYPKDEFERNLAEHDVDLSQVVIVPGFYEDSLTDAVKEKHQLTAASIVMIDCDLYSSSRTVLNFITDLVVQGTVLIFDDWLSFKGNPDLGEQRACREWLKENPQLSLTPFAKWKIYQQSFIVHRAD